MIETRYIDDFAEFWEEHGEFVNSIYKEAQGSCNTERPLDIDLELYQQLIDNNTVTALEIYADDVFVGYTSIVIAPALLNKGEVDAKIDHLALSKEARAKGYATDVVREIQYTLKVHGITELTLVLPCTQMHDMFAESLGFTKSVSLHIKNLGDS